MKLIKYQRHLMQKLLFILLYAAFTTTLTGQSASIPPGSFLINMGIEPQTVGNGLKPYGLLYDLTHNHSIPVIWSINPLKTKDGVDFNYSGTDYKGGSFIIPAPYRTGQVDARIAYWQGLGVVGVTTTTEVTVPVYATLYTAPRWTLDKQNGDIVLSYFVNAGIPSTAYGGSNPAGWKDPANLACCDDTFIMPHADPEWETHANLLYWNAACKGGIWAACHAVSALENMINPANRNEQTNFLTKKDPTWTGTSVPYAESNSLILWGDHKDGTKPYTYRLNGDPVAQFMGVLDDAVNNGSERIFVPRQGVVSNPSTYSPLATSRWNPSARIVVYDPTQQNVTTPDLSTFKNVAAVVVYGRGFEDEQRGWVMYEAGHSHEGTTPQDIAAQRAMFNFSLLAANDKVVAVPDLSLLMDTVVSGTPASFHFTLPPPADANDYEIAWSSSCGGSFSPTATQQYVSFTPPNVYNTQPCLITVTVTDSCGRRFFNSRQIHINGLPGWQLSKVSTKIPNHFVAVGEQIPYTFRLTNTGYVDISSIILTDPMADAMPVRQTDETGDYDAILEPGEVWKYAATHTVVQADLDAGDYVNTAIATGQPLVGTLAPASDTEIVPAVQQPAIDITKTITAYSQYALNDKIRYSISVQNTGNVTLLQVVVTDPNIDAVPGLVYLSGDVNANGKMEPGETWQYQAFHTASVPDMQNGSFTNSASVSAITATGLPVSDISAATATAITADVAVNKTASVPSVIAGTTFTYTITVTNRGPSTAVNVIVSDPFPAQVDFLNASPDKGTWNNNQWTIGQMNAGTVAILQLTVRAKSNLLNGTSFLNTCQVQSTTYDPVIINNTSSVSTDVITRADLQLTKSDITDPVKAGQKLRYRLSVYNAGPSDARLVNITDVIPTGISGSQYSTDGGVNWNVWPTLYQNNDLAAGETFVVLIEGTTAPNLANGTVLTNTAQTSSSTPDPNLTNNIDTATTTLLREADLEVIKTQINPVLLPQIVPVTPPTGIAGTLLYYELFVRNYGPSHAQHTLLTDVIPTGMLQPQFSVDNGTSWTNWTGSYSLNDFYGTSSILIRGTIGASEAGILTNTATVSSDTPDPYLPNNTDTEITQLRSLADLSVFKEELIIPLLESGPVSYRITVNNDGPSDALTVVVYDVIVPTVITNPEYSLDNGLTWGTWQDSLLLGAMDEHQQISFLVRGTLYDAAPLPNINPVPNTASVRSRITPDPNLPNNQYTIQTPLNEEADLSIIKKGPATVYAGEPIDYTLTIKNNSSVFASATILVFDEIEEDDILNTIYSLDNGVTWLPWSDQISIPRLEPQDSVVVFITGTVKSSLRGSLFNLANVLSLGTPDPDPTNNFSSVTTQILVRADMRMKKVQISPQHLPLDYDNLPADISSLAMVPAEAVPGTLVYYALQYMNNGPSDAELIVVDDIIPSQLSNVQYAPCRSSFRPWTGAVTVGTVEAGKGCVLLLRGIIDPSATGLLPNTAFIDAPDIPDPDPDNDTSTWITTLTPLANLSILKHATPSSLRAGDTVIFNLQVKNHGPSTALQVQTTDVLPAGLHLIDAIPSRGSWTYPVWNIGTLLPNEVQTITIRAYTDLLPDNSELVNTAVVSAVTPDPDMTNNRSSASLTVQAHPALTLKKEIIGTDRFDQAGQTIHYAYHLTNSGDVDLETPAVIADDVIGTIYPCGVWPLRPGETTTCNASYTVTQVDVNRGFVTNHATASTYYLDTPVFSNTDAATAYANQQPEIQIDKIPASVNGVPFPATYRGNGDVLTYRFVVTNTGNLSLLGIQVTDLKIPGSPQYQSGDAGNDRILQPGESWTFIGSCQVNQLDVDKGSFTNIATVTGLADLNGDGIGEGLVTDRDTAVIFGTLLPAVEVTKQRININNDPIKTRFSLPGDKIMYTLRMKNTGNITVYTPAMSDPLADASPVYTGGDTNMNGQLDVGEEWSYRAQCTVTQAMIDKGSFSNVATGSARWDADMNGTLESVVSDTGTTVTQALQQAHVMVHKTAVSVNGSQQAQAFSKAGDVIVYRLTLTNDGNITLLQPRMLDPLATTGPMYVSGDVSGPGILNPGETWVFTATHIISSVEATRATFTNVATGTALADTNGDGSGETQVSDSDQVTLPRITSETGGYVWHDLNGDGQQSAGEPPMPNVPVYLCRLNGEYVATAFTDASGYYTFSNILPGDYYCRFNPPATYIPTFAHMGDDVTDSDMDGTFGSRTTSAMTYDAISTQQHFDAGFYLCIPVGDLVWFDTNKNDVWDSFENGINGLAVRIWKKESTIWRLWSQTKTGRKPGSPSDDGYFSFCVPPGEFYLDISIPFIGLVKVRANIGTNEEADSDFPLSGNPAKTLPFTVRSGEVRMDFGAGFYLMSSLGNTVWHDRNINGIRDEAEPGVEGVRVEAIEAHSGQVVAETLTDNEGNYMLDYMEKESYYLRFTPPAGFHATYPGRGDEEKDSDVDHSFGTNTTYSIATIPGEHIGHIDMGIVQSPLAVRWMDVSGRLQDGKHIITWKTAERGNTAYYLLERRTIGDTAIEILADTIPSKGFSSGVVEYRSVQPAFMPHAGYLYRVRETDYTGAESWSDWVRLAGDGTNTSRIYPNPARHQTFAEITLADEAKISVALWRGGERIGTIEADTWAAKGVHVYPISLQGLADGIYTVEVSTGGQSTHHVLLKIE